ncbi:MAG TPA: efflux RND transporter periplasmic adaptor subunit [Steroidobacteraceae bacterium]|jgi:multidrug efflux system membrane fusion protein|nr:efflux RND transporter periplasmic adaptor subunit [Steroidobacteraceae bacterium]
MKTRLVMLGAGVLIAALFLAHRWLPGTRAEAAPKGKPDGAVVVQTATVQRADVPVYLEGLGAVQAFYTAKITARVDGQLQEVFFKEGQTVHKGEVLARIDPRTYQAALDQARATLAKDTAQLANARRDLERYHSLAPSHLASKQQIDTQTSLVTQLEAQLEADKAAIATAQTQLDYTRITSPIEGRTGIRLVDPGNNLHAGDGTGIVVVTQVQPISVVFTLPEHNVATVNGALAAGPVTVAALSRDGKTELDRGTLTLIDNQIDPTTGTVKLKATFPNTHNALWPGQFVNARVLVKTQRGALTIPSAALQRGAQGMFAYVVKQDSTVEARPIKTDGESGDIAVVHEGLAEGERVVTSNQYRLQPGSHVKPAAAEPGPDALTRAAS